MSANERQIGGDHYKGAAMEHWDFVIGSGLGYLRGCATKYIYRWKSKGGLSDLKKAGHFIEKLLDISETDDREKFRHGAHVARQWLAEFIRVNSVPSEEATIMSYLCTDDDMGLADGRLKAYIAKLEDDGMQEAPSDAGLREALDVAKTNLSSAEETISALNAALAEKGDKMTEMSAALTAAQAEVARLSAGTEDAGAGQPGAKGGKRK